MMKISKLIIAAFLAVTVSNVSAQKSPVGIVSVQDSVKSIQLGVVSSVAPDGGHGLQLSGVSNASAQTFNGLQLSGVSNITNGMDRGLQLSGLLNVSEAMMGGWQLGAINYTDSLNGAQIGVFNIARKRPKGWQIGLINLSYDSIGHKIGLVNVNPMTDIDVMLYGGSSTKANIAVRYHMFVTLFVGVFDLQTGHLRYCNAGHDAPYIQNTLLPCDANLPIGVMPDMKYSEQETTIAPGMTLFLYTDGLTEAENVDQELFGMQRIDEVIKTFEGSPQELIETMTNAVHRYVGDTEQSDDLTMLAFKYIK